MSRYDVEIVDAACYLLPISMRVPLKFGNQVLTRTTCARVCVKVAGSDGRTAVGWGETPLSVGWGWPTAEPYDTREQAFDNFTMALTRDWQQWRGGGHPIEIGHDYQRRRLTAMREQFAAEHGIEVPLLAALIALSPLDIALHDAYGILHGVPVYETYNSTYMNRDLASYLTAAPDTDLSFAGRYPEDYLQPPQTTLPVWHLVGGLDPIAAQDLTGNEPDDGYPVLLRDWIRADGLTCLKVKLRGTDQAWDYQRLVDVGRIAVEEGALSLTADFNCTVEDPAYVCAVLDRLQAEEPALFDMMLYVEQPFPHDLEAHLIDVHSVSARQPLFLDESAHNWELVRLGRSLGWTGVALKTCKTQTGALLSLAWARAHGMLLMVQDLSNPMLAQLPHVQLAAHAGTIRGVESNGMQFFPAASAPEAAVHPGLYRRRDGVLDLSSIEGPGFGYRLAEIGRELPAAAVPFSARASR